MRVAVVLPTDLFHQRGGFPMPATRALRLVEMLRAKGAEVHLIEWLRWPHGLPERETRDGLHYQRISRQVPTGGLVARAGFVLGLTREVRERIVALQPGAIVTQDEELLLACVQAAKALKVPFFLDSQEHWTGLVAETSPREARLYRLLERRAAPYLSHVYTAVEGVADEFRVLGVPTTVIYNSKDAAVTRPHELPRAEAKARLGLAQDKFVWGFSGIINDDRGLKHCVEALTKLPDDVLLVVLGGPEEKQRELEDLAEMLGVRERYRGLRPVKPDEAVRVGCAFDAGVMTFVGEGPQFTYRLPYKFFEYMALGTPIVVSDYPDMKRVAIDEVGFGVLSKPGDAASIAAAVRKLRDDPALRKAMERRARDAFDNVYAGEHQRERIRASHPFWR